MIFDHGIAASPQTMHDFGSHRSCPRYHWLVRAVFGVARFRRFSESLRNSGLGSGRDGMSTIRIDVEPLAVDATCADEALRVVLADGREIAVPLVWFPRLQKATPEQRKRWRLIGGGVGLHWEDVDEDPSVESLLATKPILVVAV